MLLEHLIHRFDHVVKHLLSLLLPRIEGTLGHADSNLVLAGFKPTVRLLGELIQGHADCTPVFYVWLVFGVVQFRLHRWRENLNHFNLTGARLELLS